MTSDSFFAALGRTSILLTLLSCERAPAGDSIDVGVDDATPDAPEDAPAAPNDAMTALDASYTGPTPITIRSGSLRYVPEGCTHDVWTPEVDLASRGGTRVGDAPTPVRVHISHASDPTSSIAVVWQTDLDTQGSDIWIGRDENLESAMRFSGHALVYATEVSPEGTRLHEVHVCGLEPNTRYFYRVGMPGATSEVFDFSTAPAVGSEQPWRFAATGDARNNIGNVWQVIQERVYGDGVDLQIFSGDAVATGQSQLQWNAFLSARTPTFEIQDLFARVPFMVSNGNHEALSVNYLAQFAMPQTVETGESATGEEWYSFDYANAHFVVLNDTVASSDIIREAQATWLRADLQRVDRSRTPWVFAVHHKPLYTCDSGHAPETRLREAWQPIYEEFDVDIVFNGHNHVYERSKPIRGLTATGGQLAPAVANGLPRFAAPGEGSGDPSGVLYLVSGGAGAPLYPVSTTCAETQVATSEANYVIVSIEGRRLMLEARNPMTGQVLDSFELVK